MVEQVLSPHSTMCGSLASCGKPKDSERGLSQNLPLIIRMKALFVN